jgi:hypothetical protein
MASQAVVKLPIVGDAHSVPRYITFALYYLLMGSDMVSRFGKHYRSAAACHAVEHAMLLQAKCVLAI